jgi:hypothetical protein
MQLNLKKLGLGKRATLFMFSHERPIVEELGSFAHDCFRRSQIRISDSGALITSISRLALARVSGIDPDHMRRFSVEVVWLAEGQDLPDARFVEHAIEEIDPGPRPS